jgi:hypothetical protein
MTSLYAPNTGRRYGEEPANTINCSATRVSYTVHRGCRTASKAESPRRGPAQVGEKWDRGLMPGCEAGSGLAPRLPRFTYRLCKGTQVVWKALGC